MLFYHLLPFPLAILRFKIVQSPINGAPGLYSSRYGTTDRDRIARLLGELAGVSDRRAQFICALAIANPQGEIVLQAEGTCPGEILPEPRGMGGFGYDPVFYLPDCRQTFAEMPARLKQKISHRGRAFELLFPQLQSLKT